MDILKKYKVSEEDISEVGMDLTHFAGAIANDVNDINVVDQGVEHALEHQALINVCYGREK